MHTLGQWEQWKDAHTLGQWEHWKDAHSKTVGALEGRTYHRTVEGRTL